jgi:hypothetical protein
MHPRNARIDESNRVCEECAVAGRLLPNANGVMHRTLRVALVMLLVACSGNTRSSTPHVEPPELVRNTRPELRTPTGTRQGLVLDIRLEVMVDPTGRADMSTFRLTGLGAADNEPIVKEWLATATFRPGRQAGVPVRALYKNAWSAEARTVIRRSP